MNNVLNTILSKIVNKKEVSLIALQNGGYQIKSGNLTRTFKKTPFELVFDYYMEFQ